MDAVRKLFFGVPIPNSDFDDDEPDPDWDMNCDGGAPGSSEMLFHETNNCPPELSPYASPVKRPPELSPYASPVKHPPEFSPYASPVKHPPEFSPYASPMKRHPEFSPNASPIKRPPELSPYASPIKRPPELSPNDSPVKQYKRSPIISPMGRERRRLFATPTNVLSPAISPIKERTSPFPSPLKAGPVFSHQNDSFPSVEFQTPEKRHVHTTPVKSGFGFGPRTTPEKVSYGSYLSPVEAPYESEEYVSHKPFKYADLLPQHEDKCTVKIHKRQRQEAVSSSHEDKTLFFPVPDVRLQDLHDWSTTAKIEGQEEQDSPRKSKVEVHTGHLVEVNRTEVALFRYGTHVFGIKEQCPHAAGPLHVGDIEFLPDMTICVRCPWHGWKFDLMTGRARRPLGRQETTDVYPVKVGPDGALQIGFDHFDPKLLMDDF